MPIRSWARPTPYAVAALFTVAAVGAAPDARAEKPAKIILPLVPDDEPAPPSPPDPPRAGAPAATTPSAPPSDHDVVATSPTAAAPITKDAVARSAPRDVDHATVTVEPRVSLGTRHFNYVDRITPGQRSYGLSAAPMTGIAGGVYPFAPLATPMLESIGVVGEIEKAVGLRSATSSGEHVGTSWSSYAIALRGRFTPAERVAIGVRAGVGEVAYAFDDAGPLDAELPAAKYRYLDVGVDGRVAIWKIALLAGFDYLDVQSASGVADRYPHATIGGIDFMAGIAVPFAEHFEARTGVRYQHFFYSMHPLVGEASVAGGATDDFGRWDASVAFSY